MSIGVVISSNNFSGQTADITFYPDTGGTQNLGSHVIPYTVQLDYPYGVYDLYFSAYTKTCGFYIANPDNNYLLQENGYYLLQEDNSNIIIT
jgi:hypothetical protein